jgi:hypothetical protein
LKESHSYLLKTSIEVIFSATSKLIFSGTYACISPANSNIISSRDMPSPPPPPPTLGYSDINVSMNNDVYYC